MKVCNTKTRKQYNTLMQAMEDLGWHIASGSIQGWDEYKSRTLVELDEVFYLSHSKMDNETLLTLPEALEYLERFKEAKNPLIQRPTCFICDDMEPERTEITWENLRVGDVLTCLTSTITLVFRGGPIWFFTFRSGSVYFKHIDEMKRQYTIKQPKNTTERSVEDVLKDKKYNFSTQDKEIIKQHLR